MIAAKEGWLEEQSGAIEKGTKADNGKHACDALKALTKISQSRAAAIDH